MRKLKNIAINQFHMSKQDGIDEKEFLENIGKCPVNQVKGEYAIFDTTLKKKNGNSIAITFKCPMGHDFLHEWSFGVGIK